MTSNWIGIAIGACLVLLQNKVKGQFLYPMCGQSETTSSRLANGVDALLGSAPFMAYLMKNNKYHSGGSIISRTYILTAAHCVERGLIVRLGEYDDRTNPDCVGMVCVPQHEDFDIVFIAHHHQYNNVSLANDIALIKLNRSIIFKQHIQPICLYSNPRMVPNFSEYIAFGWGKLGWRKSESHVLQTTNLQFHPKIDCQSPFRTLSRNQMCAGSPYSDTCPGDSGSPLVTEVNTNDRDYKYVQMGIVSSGDKRCSGPGVYTYVPNYATWILNTVRYIDMKFPHI